jgi:hypothetical protein
MNRFGENRRKQFGAHPSQQPPLPSFPSVLPSFPSDPGTYTISLELSIARPSNSYSKVLLFR